MISLEGANAAVAVHGNDQDIPQLARLRKQSRMTRMEQVEAAVGKNHAYALPLELINLFVRLLEGQDLFNPHGTISLYGNLRCSRSCRGAISPRGSRLRRIKK